MPAPNPISQRIDEIFNYWVVFANDADARVAIWRTRSDEYSLVHAFIQVEQHETAGTLPDLFLQLKSPFSASTSYIESCKKELQDYAQALLEGVREASQGDEPPPVTADGYGEWICPARVNGQDDATYFAVLALHFRNHFRLPGLLALVLEPKEIANEQAFAALLVSLAAILPSEVRVLVLDSDERPSFVHLAGVMPRQVRVQTLALEVAAAQLQISQQAGNLDTPGGRYRHLFLGFTQLLGKGHLARAKEVSVDLLELVASQKWYAMALPVRLAMGAAYAAASKPQEAQLEYLAAEAAAKEGEEAGDEPCKKLRVQAALVRGGHLIAEKRFAEAATCFEGAAPLAAALPDLPAQLDCLRLCSFAYEQLKEPNLAWQWGQQALAVGRNMTAEQRAASTLAYVGEGMLRIANAQSQAPLVQQIDHEMTSLLGTSAWRPAPPPAQGAGA